MPQKRTIGAGRARKIPLRGGARSVSSARWLSRQLNDPYVQAAQAQGLRSRAAYKLLEMEERYRLLAGAKIVVDLGAAPGGWSEIARALAPPSARCVAVDILPIAPIRGVDIICGDFQDASVQAACVKAMGARGGKKAGVILSDMSPPLSGVAGSDHWGVLELARSAFAFAQAHLQKDGSFCAKLLQGEGLAEFVADLRPHFTRLVHAKPKASRAQSREVYIVGRGYRG